jgi:hypothetical protein
MDRMKVTHLIPRLYIGGAERILLDLCLHGKERQKVVTAEDGPMRPVLEQHGVEVQIGANRAELMSHLADADVVNVHWIGCRPDLFEIAVATGRPMVVSMQWISVLPQMPGLVICSSKHIYDLQEPNRDRRVLITNGIDTTRFQRSEHRSHGTCGEPLS